MSPTISEPDQSLRCAWALRTPLETIYHDCEWGVPQHDDQVLFEFLILEGAQAGLSWSTVLAKRESYRAAFDQFDVKKVATYTDGKLAKLLLDPGIIRNRLKVYSARTNAQAFLKVQEEFGSFDKYYWAYANNKPIINRCITMMDVPARTELSDRISKDLQKRGFKFIGSTIMYAYMQATGMINDHLLTCPRHAPLSKSTL
jgi:DNA-3-methyladenine glycosylase I